MVFHVLAVDDTATDRKIIECFLKKSACQVTCVDSGFRALELLGLQEEDDHHQNKPYKEVDMIITDYSMPGMTGYELLKKVKGSKKLKHIPVVIMSSEPIPSRINKCLEEGAEEFFLKPVKFGDVEKLKSDLVMKRKTQTHK